jgi:hypothetical protein
MIAMNMKQPLQNVFFILRIVTSFCPMRNTDHGSHLRMSYKKLQEATMRKKYLPALSSIVVQGKRVTQVKDASIWQDTCLNYFLEFSKMPIPQ